LVRKLQAAFGERLVSAILYGSAAIGDWQQKTSDLNVLCVLDRITAAELAKSDAVFRWWREKGQRTPLLLTAEELRESTDCFAMEFHDMQQHRKVLHGSDVIVGLTIEDRFYRAEVEHELRSKQIRLRQKASELLPDRKRLLALLTDSISTFCVLGRHVLVLSGQEPRWKKQEILAELEGLLGSPFTNCAAILAMRQSGDAAASGDAVSLLDGYLKETDALVRFVDQLATP
jgi:predicted nucleotidyltransferase